MADNPFSVRPVNALEALLAGEQGYNSMRDIISQRRGDAGRRAAQESLMGGDTRSALAQLIGANDPRMVQALGAYETAANTVYGTPIYGTVNGETALGTFDKGGRFRPIDTGAFKPTPGIRTIDTGTGTVILDSRTGAPVSGGTYQQPQPGQPAPMRPQPQAGYVPKDVAGEAREKQYGKEVGDRQADLGKAKTSLDSSVSNIDRMADVAKSIINDPALASITGIQGVFPNWPGGRAANVQARLENLTSQAGFAVLQAMRDASKTGGALGQVSDFENRALQNNLAALQRAQSAAQFKAELQKLIAWGEGVKTRLQAAYDQDYANLPKPNPSVQPTTQTAPAPGAQRPVTRSIGGKNYIKVDGKWYEQ